MILDGNERRNSILVQPGEQKGHKRRVSFNSMAEICVLSPSKEPNNANEEDLWWRARDYKHMKNECKEMVKRKILSDCSSLSSSDEESFGEDNDWEFRGLERMIDRGEYRKTINNAVRAVKREQTRQRLDGVRYEDSDRFLAEVYRAYCAYSTLEAERIGREDAEKAREIWMDDSFARSSALSFNHVNDHPSPATQDSRPSSSSTPRTKATEPPHQTSSMEFQSSSERFQGSFKMALVNMIYRRRRRAWI